MSEEWVAGHKHKSYTKQAGHKPPHALNEAHKISKGGMSG